MEERKPRCRVYDQARQSVEMKIWYFPLIAFSVLSIRYLLLSVSAYEIFWRWKKERFAHLRIQKTFPKNEQLLNEVKWSLSTFLIFSVGAIFLYHPIMSGETKLYFNFDKYGLGYLLFSLVFVIFAHDAYFYWAHRFMHLKWLFKHVHRVHHLSTNPSPLAAFSFHPLEALIEGGFMAVIIFIIPFHPLILGIFLLFSHMTNVMGHLGYELFPSGFTRHPILGFINSSTHHNMHHRYFTNNYGFYFNFWDRLLGTNHPQYDEAFEDVVQPTSE